MPVYVYTGHSFHCHHARKGNNNVQNYIGYGIFMGPFNFHYSRSPVQLLIENMIGGRITVANIVILSSLNRIFNLKNNCDRMTAYEDCYLKINSVTGTILFEVTVEIDITS